jgi:putative FmdB family regulatory protein
MPTYEYRCAACGRRLEAVQKFSDPALTECPECHAEALRRVFGSVGVVLKGPGFYRTDSRSSSGNGSRSDKSESKSEKSESKSDGGSKSESKSDGGSKSGGSGSSGSSSSKSEPAAKTA